MGQTNRFTDCHTNLKGNFQHWYSCKLLIGILHGTRGGIHNAFGCPISYYHIVEILAYRQWSQMVMHEKICDKLLVLMIFWCEKSLHYSCWDVSTNWLRGIPGHPQKSLQTDWTTGHPDLLTLPSDCNGPI